MKTIGLIGGMSWESTQTYYSLINRAVNRELGGFHSAKIVMVSVDFAEIERCQSDGNWDGAAVILRDAANQLIMAGADCIAICTNTMHIVFDQVCDGINVPCLHIGDALGEFASRNDHLCLGLLGTRFTMEKSFLSDRLHSNFGIDVIIPNEEQRQAVHRIIYEELCHGEINDSSRDVFLRVIENLSRQGASGVILGCTEIGLLIDQGHTQLPVLDTTALHAQSLVNFALRSI